MNDVIKRLGDFGLVPVIKIDRVEDAVPLAKALCDGGLPLAEVTFRTPAAEMAIKEMSKAFPDMLIGAGTVLTIEQVDKAIAAGATFIVSPGLNPKIVKYCVDKGIAITPGCTNPSDIEQAIELGLDVVKFFPAEAAGGLAMIKAMAAPYVNMKFMPTGGITAKNLNEYLAFDKIIACGGSFMVNETYINNGEFDKITKLTKDAVNTMLGFEIEHIGINEPNADAAKKTANTFSDIFNLTLKEGNSSIFAARSVEVMKTIFKGEKGHIAFKTGNVERAVAYLEARGVEFDYSSLKQTEKGKYIAIYLKEQISGFAIHLV